MYHMGQEHLFGPCRIHLPSRVVLRVRRLIAARFCYVRIAKLEKRYVDAKPERAMNEGEEVLTEKDNLICAQVYGRNNVLHVLSVLYLPSKTCGCHRHHEASQGDGDSAATAATAALYLVSS